MQKQRKAERNYKNERGKGRKKEKEKERKKSLHRIIIPLPSLVYTSISPSTLPASVRFNYAFLPSPTQAAYTSYYVLYITVKYRNFVLPLLDYMFQSQRLTFIHLYYLCRAQCSVLLTADPTKVY